MRKPNCYEPKMLDTGRFLISQDGTIWRPDLGKSAIEAHRTGYGMVRVSIGGKPHQAMAHRLVWVNFRGPIPPNREINHINGNKMDNRLSNLELCTRGENISHAFRTGLRKPRYQGGESNPSAKLTWDKAEEIRSRYASGGISQGKLASCYGIHQADVWKIVNRRGWVRPEMAATA